MMNQKKTMKLFRFESLRGSPVFSVPNIFQDPKAVGTLWAHSTVQVSDLSIDYYLRSIMVNDNPTGFIQKQV